MTSKTPLNSRDLKVRDVTAEAEHAADEIAALKATKASLTALLDGEAMIQVTDPAALDELTAGERFEQFTLHASRAMALSLAIQKLDGSIDEANQMVSAFDAAIDEMFLVFGAMCLKGDVEKIDASLQVAA